MSMIPSGLAVLSLHHIYQARAARFDFIAGDARPGPPGRAVLRRKKAQECRRRAALLAAFLGEDARGGLLDAEVFGLLCAWSMEHSDCKADLVVACQFAAHDPLQAGVVDRLIRDGLCPPLS